MEGSGENNSDNGKGPDEFTCEAEEKMELDSQTKLHNEQVLGSHLGPSVEPQHSDCPEHTDSSLGCEETGQPCSSIQQEQTHPAPTIKCDNTVDQCSGGPQGSSRDLCSFDQTHDVKPGELICGSVVSPSTGSLGLLSMQYRDNSSDENVSDSDSDSSSSTSSSSTSSSSSSSETFGLVSIRADEEEDHAQANGKSKIPVKTHDELLIYDLPAVENLTISLPSDTNIEPIGRISSIVEQLVIVETYRNTHPLNEDSVLFTQNKFSIGKVFEIFGPVFQPYYVVRFNTHDEISQKNLNVHDTVYFAPKMKDFTDYIFTEQLKPSKGSDASWKNDQEPPLEALDFSDDEQEKMAKQKLKEQKRWQQQKDADIEEVSTATKATRGQTAGRRPSRRNRNNPRGQHHNRGAGFHSNYPAYSPFPQDYNFPHSDPHMFSYQCPPYPPYPGPPYHMGMCPWPPGVNQGFMFHPPPPPPPPPSSNQ